MVKPHRNRDVVKQSVRDMKRQTWARIWGLNFPNRPVRTRMPGGVAGEQPHGCPLCRYFKIFWRSQRDSNPRFSLERATTWATSRWDPIRRLSWLGNRDSNPDYLIQSQACCRCTIPQSPTEDNFTVFSGVVKYGLVRKQLPNPQS